MDVRGGARIVPALCLALLTHVADVRAGSDAQAIADRIGPALQRAAYMASGCAPVVFPGWEGYATRRCAYVVRDSTTGRTKSGLVVLLDPSALQLSAWLLSACRTVRPQQPLAECVDRLFRRVIAQSGGQFPVAGIVYEDLIPQDGVYEAYGFRNGVTVRLSGVTHRDTEPMRDEQLVAALSAPVLSTITESAPARIAGVTRAEYANAHPGVAVDGLQWLAVVAMEHRRAMRSDRNGLLEAWLRGAP